MLVSKEVDLKVNGNNLKHLEEKGYYIPRKKNKYGKITIPLGTTIKVKVEDLPLGSHILVKVLCDYCLEQGNEKIIEKEYRRYIRDNVNSIVHKDCCDKCQPLKTKECNLINYGVESKTELKETKEKMADTWINKYGVDHAMKNKSIHNKMVKTILEKTDKEKLVTLNKRKQTLIEKYGVEKAMDIDGIKDKIIQTNLERYGVKYIMQSKEFLSKARQTMYKNGTAPCSRQQKYLWKLFGGKLNYSFDRLSLDIAFPEDKIYIEYNGNGHELSVRMGNISKKEFEIKEIKRYYFLKSRGWRKITISSFCDYLPSDNVLLKEFYKALEWFKSNDKGHWHYNVDIGNKIQDPNYGLLRRITDEDLESIS